MGRAPCCEKVGLKRGRWTAEEDKILIKYIRANGEGSWRSLPKNAGLLRCGKSCRLRWINYLRADVKRGNISAEEEEIIVKLHAALGNRWSLIAGHLPGRTDNEIKNYWNSHLSRRIDSFTRPRIDGAHMIMDLEMINRRCKRKGGRTSTSAMKKSTSNEQKSEEKQDTMDRVEKETLSGILDQNEERENVVLGPPHKGLESRIFCPDEEMEGEERERRRLGTKERLEDDFFCPDDGILKAWVMSSNEERESGVTDGVLGSCEERKSGVTGGVLGSCEVRESGATVRVLGYNEMIKRGATGGALGINEEIESGAMGANEEMGESDGWCSSMGHGLEELECLQNEWMDWDYIRMDDQTTDGGGETWPWLWGCDLSQDNFLRAGWA